MVLLLVVRAWDPVQLEAIRARTFDLFQQIKPQPPIRDNPVAIVDIDEDSLAAIGQWPWPRTTIARMVSNLGKAGAIVVGFDIVFPEADRMSPAMVAGTLPGLDDATRDKLESLPSNESVLAAAMKSTRVVVGMTGLDLPARRRDKLPKVPTVARLGADPIPWLQHFESVLRNTPEIDFAASGWGMINPTPESDGIVRRVPAMVTDGREIYPALSMEMLRLATANENLAIKTNEFGVTGIVVRPNLVPTDDHARIWVYAAEHDPRLYISAKDVVAGTFDPARVKGKLVLVGTSAAGLEDIRHTAVVPNIPGVEVHAQIIDTVLFGQQLSNPSSAASVEWVAMLVGALLMIVLVPMVGARWTLLLLIAVIAGAAGFSWYNFDRFRLLYDPVFPAATTLVTFILVTYSSYAREEAQKRQVRSAFSLYLSPALVEQLAADPARLKLGGETRDMTILFCDIRGFTTISELFDAQGLTHLINRFLTPMTNIILDRQGTIDKYMGDCIMAFWNAPLDDGEHAIHACDSALAMNERLVLLNNELEAEAKVENRRHVPIRIGIGLNSGPVVAGNVGSDFKLAYSVLGDNVNLASRLEGQSKGYGVTIVIGENTRERAPGFACLELDLIKVKGKTEAVRIYTLLGTPEVAQSEGFKALEAEHSAMLSAYRAQDWEAAKWHMARCRQLDPGLHLEHLYEIFAERVAEFEANPPGADWDGVYVATSK